MRRVSAAICAGLIALTPVAATAHWATYRSDHHPAGGHRASYGRRHRDYVPHPADPPGLTCGLGLRDRRGRLRRCAAARAAFERANPCPSTGQPAGPCPGYVIDHIVALKRGGADDPSNMQWQTVADAKAKDKIE